MPTELRLKWLTEGVTGIYLVINRFLTELAGKQQLPKAAEMAEVVGIPLLGVVPEDSAVIAATLQGEAVYCLYPEAPASKAFQIIARRIPGKD